ncbi:helix-turn-helix transcriptional regulator [Rhizobiaceae bacterium CRRU44]|uniref:Helix-turn-helix transcriptional regulator n=1 Tax=Ferranicluibacter rubi TaxID=2715133 RepID=A0AA44CAH5_9HYPH|nr:helix-turn-helix transcriptional regulator [Ferranicluibacter rubi]NHT75918.1 helix-turn-helix transcriptional regulator [Ferranicluibacter rubi]NHT75978.1 helix-turn-helix transcriptional regulator [Ferranicluibacter rubi]
MPEQPPRDAPEHIRARYWREHIAKMSRPELAEAIGYSVSSIGDMEAGMNRITKKPVDAVTMKRYRLLCMTVGLMAEFDWDEMSMMITEPIELRMWGRLRVKERRK